MKTLLQKYIDIIDDPKTGMFFWKDHRETSKQFADKMKTEDDMEGLKYLMLESDNLKINKSIENGLSPTMRGTREEGGKTIEVIYPDYTLYEESDYDYFEKRYNETNNAYLKTEYGLMLFAKGRIMRNDQKISLYDTLVQLIDLYKAKALEEGDTLYLHPMDSRIFDTMELLNRSGKTLNDKTEIFINKIQEWLINMDFDHEAFVAYAMFVAEASVSHKKLFKPYINTSKVKTKIEDGVAHYEAKKISSAILLCQKLVKFNESYQLVSNNIYHERLGILYETQGDLQLTNNPFGSAKNYEDSILHLHFSKNQIALDRVSKKYEENKGKMQMGIISTKASEDSMKKVNEFIDAIIEKRSPEAIIAILYGSSLFPAADTVEKEALKASQQNSMINLATTVSMDKYGNTIRLYPNTEDKLLYHKIQIICTNHDLSLQLQWHVVKRAIREKIISFDHIKEMLESTWLNTEVKWHSGGEIESTIPLKSILPGIQYFFNEVEKWLFDEEKKYVADMVLCSDSLTTKIEMILRLMARRINLPTFKYTVENEVFVSHEKNLREIIDILNGHISDDDINLIRFVLNEKGGSNIRNRVAHGLVDYQEYTPAIPLTMITLIIRLSQYAINVNQNVSEEEKINETADQSK
jgi:hypothetical protein